MNQKNDFIDRVERPEAVLTVYYIRRGTHRLSFRLRFYPRSTDFCGVFPQAGEHMDLHSKNEAKVHKAVKIFRRKGLVAFRDEWYPLAKYGEAAARARHLGLDHIITEDYTIVHADFTVENGDGSRTKIKGQGYW